MRRSYYFGCWAERAGHFLWTTSGSRATSEPFLESVDGLFAPRVKFGREFVCENSSGRDGCRDTAEAPQGDFLRHHMVASDATARREYTIIAWWDRTQGDSRGGCNSAFILEGDHTSEEMLAALRCDFPSVVANLVRAGVVLREVKLGPLPIAPDINDVRDAVRWVAETDAFWQTLGQKPKG